MRTIAQGSSERNISVVVDGADAPRALRAAHAGSDRRIADVRPLLRRLGHDVTVYEAMPEPGGMLRYGIPSYRLPPEELARDIRRIEAVGVEIVCDTPLGGPLTLDGLRETHDAVFLGIGAWSDWELGVEGEEAEGVVSGIGFLREVAEGKQNRLSGPVVVIGGGNTAFDVARTALRLGADSVTVAYRRTRGEMPALAEEIADAEEEGVVLELLASPVRIQTEREGGRESVGRGQRHLPPRRSGQAPHDPEDRALDGAGLRHREDEGDAGEDRAF